MFRPKWLRSFGARGKSSGGAKSRRRMGAFEALESRALLSASPLSTLTAHPLISPLVTNTVPYGYTPAEIRQAYGFDQIAFTTSSGSVSGTGAGTNDRDCRRVQRSERRQRLEARSIRSLDVAAPPKFSVVNENGSSRLPYTDAGWSLEISLDVEWAHAIAPGANILLVEANSASLGDLLTRGKLCAAATGRHGRFDELGRKRIQRRNLLRQLLHHPGRPCAGHVRGLVRRQRRRRHVAGGFAQRLGGRRHGVAVDQFPRPRKPPGRAAAAASARMSRNRRIKTACRATGRRTTPDVAYDASPSTGLAVYDSVSYAGESGWFTVGGTSAGAPQWAALVAIANQGRALNGAAAQQDGPTALYALPSSDFYDVTSGHNNEYSATTGYDGVTGLGAPNANLIVENLVYGLNPFDDHGRADDDHGDHQGDTRRDHEPQQSPRPSLGDWPGASRRRQRASRRRVLGRFAVVRDDRGQQRRILGGGNGAFAADAADRDALASRNGGFRARADRFMAGAGRRLRPSFVRRRSGGRRLLRRVERAATARRLTPTSPPETQAFPCRRQQNRAAPLPNLMFGNLFRRRNVGSCGSLYSLSGEVQYTNPTAVWITNTTHLRAGSRTEPCHSFSGTLSCLGNPACCGRHWPF